MKAKLLTLAAAALVVGGLSSCNKTATNGTTGSEGTGNVKITVSFSSPTTKADVSDDVLRPTTSASDLSSFSLILVNSENNQVVSTQDITALYKQGSNTAYMQNIPIGKYKVYAVANYTDAATTAYQYGYGGLPGTVYTIPSENSTFSSGELDIAKATVPTGRLEYDGDVYTAAPNYFTGVSDEVEVQIDANAPAAVTLSRPVNLVRVKVALGPNNLDSSNNPMVIFNDEDAAMFIRRANSTYDFVTSTYNFATSAIGNSICYSGGEFTSTSGMSIPEGYTGNESYFENWSDTYLWYKDMLVFPPSSTAETSSDQNAQYYNLVLQGVVDSDSYPVNGADKGTVVSWAKNINLSTVDSAGDVYKGNQIVVLNITLTSTGYIGEVPSVGDYGNVEVEVTLEDWAGIIEYTDSI